MRFFVISHLILIALCSVGLYFSIKHENDTCMKLGGVLTGNFCIVQVE